MMRRGVNHGASLSSLRAQAGFPPAGVSWSDPSLPLPLSTGIFPRTPAQALALSPLAVLRGGVSLIDAGA